MDETVKRNLELMEKGFPLDTPLATLRRLPGFKKAYNKAYKKAYQKTDKYKAYQKAYNKANKDKIAEKVKAYYQNVVKPRKEKETSCKNDEIMGIREEQP